MPDVELPVEPSSELTEAEWADDHYIAAFDSERASLLRLECLDGGVFIPMRCT